MIRTYAEAAAHLGKKVDRPLPGRATRLIRRSETTIAVRYQATDVVTYHADGPTVLESGGWLSVTTKARMNEYTRANIFASKGRWEVRTGSDWHGSAFYNGMRITDSGEPLEPRAPATRKTAALDKKVRAYIKAFAAHVAAGQLEDPSGGDCWACFLNKADAPDVTQGPMRRSRPTPHGRVEPMGLDHYLGHLTDQYFVPSLLWNAIKARGYQDPALIWHLIKDRKDGRMAEENLRAFFRNLKPQLLEGASK